MMPIGKGELRWLARQSRPVWGGVLKRYREGKPTDEAVVQAARMGFIKVVGNEGYVIASLGREMIQHACPTCGQIVRE